LPNEGDDRGFFAPGVAMAAAPEQVAVNLGSGLVALKRAHEALQTLAEASVPTAKWQSVVTTNTAASFVLLDEPERACAALLAAAGYAMDTKRIHGVRRRFPKRWRTLRCVQELDERLRMA
jgi:hypothetical protein